MKASQLKANELRIGNYINYANSVKKLDAELFLHLLKYTTPFEPIPLTEEWLLKFGFGLRDGFSNTFKLNVEKHQYDCSEITYSEKEGLLRFSNGQEKGATLIPHIKYVHQLQNLYFALTGEELTLEP